MGTVSEVGDRLKTEVSQIVSEGGNKVKEKEDIREDVEREETSGISLCGRQVLDLAFPFPNGQGEKGGVGFLSHFQGRIVARTKILVMKMFCDHEISVKME